VIVPLIAIHGIAKNLPGKAETKTGMFAKPQGEQLLFILNTNAVSIIFDDSDQNPFSSLFVTRRAVICSPIPQGVISTIEEHFPEQGIGENLQIGTSSFNTGG
jgi:hypothetical protein